MAIDLEKRVGIATKVEVADWVEKLAGPTLALRSERIALMERAAADLSPRRTPSLRPGPGFHEEVTLLEQVEREGSSATPAGTAAPPRNAGGAPAVLLALGIFVLFCVVGAGAGFALRAPKRASAPVAAAPPIAPRAAESVAATKTAPPTIASSAPPPAVRKAPPPVAAAKPKPKPEPEPEPASTATCDPPFTIDEAGHRHYKLSCLPKE
jgi:hypothetical protein